MPNDQSNIRARVLAAFTAFLALGALAYSQQSRGVEVSRGLRVDWLVESAPGLVGFATSSDAVYWSGPDGIRRLSTATGGNELVLEGTDLASRFDTDGRHVYMFGCPVDGCGHHSENAILRRIELSSGQVQQIAAEITAPHATVGVSINSRGKQAASNALPLMTTLHIGPLPPVLK